MASKHNAKAVKRLRELIRQFNSGEYQFSGMVFDSDVDELDGLLHHKIEISWTEIYDSKSI